MSLYNKLNTTDLKKIIKDLQSSADSIGVDFFAIGALARNIWYVENGHHPRGTKDVDFAIYVSTVEVYNKLKRILIDKFRYNLVKNNSFCLISPYGIPLDLLPFGEIENNEKVQIEGAGLVSINLDGFKETYLKGLVEKSLDGDNIKLCSIPAVVLLKLVSFDDRPEKRMNDPLDIASIIDYYPHLEENYIWDNYNDLYDEDSEHRDVGIMVIGCELGEIIKDNDKLSSRIIRILDDAIQGNSKLPERMIINVNSDTIKGRINDLKLLKIGIEKKL